MMKHRDEWEYRQRGPFKKTLDFISAPARALLKESWIEKIGLTTLTDERLEKVLPHIHGKYLDVGCGFNRFTKAYGSGWGTDISAFPGIDFISTANTLPVKDESFDTVSLIANLNHIPQRDVALKEAWRVLRPNGTVIATMLSPGLGKLLHFMISWWDWDRGERGHHGEDDLDGISKSDMFSLLKNAGFSDIKHKTFQLGMNHLFVAKKNV
ncbi:MAG: methyltransferase domain-containing protein [Acidobacteria bacterium]|nr:methyltransferase domain-containing protein [Acidobacteriota bacterium]